MPIATLAMPSAAFASLWSWWTSPGLRTFRGFEEKRRKGRSVVLAGLPEIGQARPALGCPACLQRFPDQTLGPSPGQSGQFRFCAFGFLLFNQFCFFAFRFQTSLRKEFLRVSTVADLSFEQTKFQP